MDSTDLSKSNTCYASLRETYSFKSYSDLYYFIFSHLFNSTRLSPVKIAKLVCRPTRYSGLFYHNLAYKLGCTVMRRFRQCSGEMSAVLLTVSR